MVSKDAITICPYTYSTGRERKKLLQSCSNPWSVAECLGRVCCTCIPQKREDKEKQMAPQLTPDEMKAFVRQHFEDFVNNKKPPLPA